MNSTRWGIMGTGSMAHLFVQALSSLPGAQIQAVVSRSEERAKLFAKQYQIARALTDFDVLVQDPAVDVVYISTPNEEHAAQSLKAVGAGKAVLCEKPFALTAAEARQVVEQARRQKVFCMEAMWMRFAPAVRETLQMARQGKLGDLKFFSGQLGFPYEREPESRLFRQPGGGALLDLGVYPLSLAQALFGSPERVSSAASLTTDRVDEQFAAILTYPGGVQASVAASLTARLSNSASIHGHQGVLQLDEPLYFPEAYRQVVTAPHTTKQKSSGRLSKLRRLPVLRTLADLRNSSKTQRVSKRSSESGYSFEAAEVQRCLREGILESPEMTLSDTLAVLESMDAIRAQWADRLVS